VLTKGDLIRIPSDTCLVQDRNELSIIDKYVYTKFPQIGIFMSYDRGEDIKVFINNDYWIVNSKDVRYVEAAC
jgi:hypothetical protein